MRGTLGEIKIALNQASTETKEDQIEFQGISTDSRSIKKGDLFIALDGETFKGSKFIGESVKKGAVAVITTEDMIVDVPVIKVENTLEAFQEIASYYRGKIKIKVVAVTGSSGKTTTKDLIYSVLKEKFKVEKTFENNNNEIGVPVTILGAQEDTEVLVVEMGMRALGEIETLTKIANPDIGVITNVGVAHLGELGSRENILEAKGELFVNLKSGGYALINGEETSRRCLLKKVLRSGGKPRIFGFGLSADIRALELKVTSEGTSFQVIRDKSEVEKAFIPLKGEHFVLDSLIAIEVGCLLGLTLREAVQGLAKVKVSKGRMSEIELKNGVTLLNDVYNANPDSTKASLEVLNLTGDRKIAVLGDMRELGPKEILLHREIGSYVAKLKIDYLLTLGSVAKEIKEGAVKLGMNPDNIWECKNHQEVFDILVKLMKSGDKILIKGSRVMGMEKIVEMLETNEEEGRNE